MTRIVILTAVATLSLASAALAGNTSSNSSSNSSNGVHTRVDTIIRDDGRGQSFYERRTYRERQRQANRMRRWRNNDDDD